MDSVEVRVDLEYDAGVSPELAVTGMQDARSHYGFGIGVTHSGRSRAGWVLGILAVMVIVVSCGGCDDTDESANREHVIGGDLLLVMEPGEGPGEFADELAALVASPFGGVREGTANHVTSFEGEYGPVHVVTFTAGRENPRGGDPEACIMFSDGAACRPGSGEPVLLDWSVGEAEVYAGADAEEAVFTTESANTVSVLTVGGYTRAEWLRDWGQPQTVEFYDSAGKLLERLEFPAED